jgi:hypothetical protein
VHLQLLTQVEAVPRRGERLGGAGKAAQGAVQRRGQRLVGRRARRRPEGIRLHRHLPPAEEPRRLIKLELKMRCANICISFENSR